VVCRRDTKIKAAAAMKWPKRQFLLGIKYIGFNPNGGVFFIYIFFGRENAGLVSSRKAGLSRLITGPLPSIYDRQEKSPGQYGCGIPYETPLLLKSCGPSATPRLKISCN
jgi:hypothetical protein